MDRAADDQADLDVQEHAPHDELESSDLCPHPPEVQGMTDSMLGDGLRHAADRRESDNAGVRSVRIRMQPNCRIWTMKIVGWALKRSLVWLLWIMVGLLWTMVGAFVDHGWGFGGSWLGFCGPWLGCSSNSLVRYGFSSNFVIMRKYGKYVRMLQKGSARIPT